MFLNLQMQVNLNPPKSYKVPFSIVRGNLGINGVHVQLLCLWSKIENEEIWWVLTMEVTVDLSKRLVGGGILIIRYFTLIKLGTLCLGNWTHMARLHICPLHIQQDFAGITWCRNIGFGGEVRQPGINWPCLLYRPGNSGPSTSYFIAQGFVVSSL